MAPGRELSIRAGIYRNVTVVLTPCNTYVSVLVKLALTADSSDTVTVSTTKRIVVLQPLFLLLILFPSVCLSLLSFSVLGSTPAVSLHLSEEKKEKRETEERGPVYLILDRPFEDPFQRIFSGCLSSLWE